MGGFEEELVAQIPGYLDGGWIAGPKSPVNFQQSVLVGFYLVKEKGPSDAIASINIFSSYFDSLTLLKGGKYNFYLLYVCKYSSK